MAKSVHGDGSADRAAKRLIEEIDSFLLDKKNKLGLSTSYAKLLKESSKKVAKFSDEVLITRKAQSISGKTSSQKKKADKKPVVLNKKSGEVKIKKRAIPSKRKSKFDFGLGKVVTITKEEKTTKRTVAKKSLSKK